MISLVAMGVQALSAERSTFQTLRYDEDWSRLWWVRADGAAEILEAGGTWAAAWAALNDKYPQYEGQTQESPVISVMIDRWNGWSHSDGGPAGTHA